MPRTVLMIAFHFPPAKGFSGTQRALTLARDLPTLDWHPLVLAPALRAYTALDEEGGGLPPEVTVHRAFCLDSARHLAWRGKYFRLFALPDRWCSWFPGAVLKGMGLVRQRKPEAIWVTYPIATAILIALGLQRWSGLPLVVDMRDPMVGVGHPDDPWVRRIHRWLEWQALQRAALVVVTTDGIRDLLLQRYPSFPPERLRVVANGYDEKAIQEAVRSAVPPSSGHRPLRLLHSGALYLNHEERNPVTLFAVLAELRQEGRISPDMVELILRGCAHEETMGAMIARFGLEGVVRLAPTTEYTAALREMAEVDGLLLLQGSHFDHLVPAKLFEYLALNRPILPLVGPNGHCAALLRHVGLEPMITPLHDHAAVRAALLAFFDGIVQNRALLPDQAHVYQLSRQHKNRQIAELLQQAVVLNNPTPRSLKFPEGD